jgi:type II secretory pathway component GspD/PulD (secretin)
MGGYGMGGMGGMGGMMGGMGGMMGGMGGYGMGGMGGMGGYGMGGMGGMGGYGQGGQGGTEDVGQEDRQQRIDDLKALIQKLVAPGTWEEEGGTNIGSLDVWNERLIVRHTRAAHRQLRELFKQLREAKDLQVAVEARFMTLSNNFLEQIGVDIDIILNQGNAGLDQALTTVGGIPQRAINPVTGMQLLQRRQNTQYGFLPAPINAGVPLAQTGNFAQPFQAAGLVPQGSPENWWDGHTTAVPLINNTLTLASPRPTGVPGGLNADTLPAFQMFGSFLDNIQVDFLLRATQLDVRGSLVDAPRLTVYSGRQADLNVSTTVSYVAYPGQLPVGGTGINGQAALGRPPGISQLPQGRLLRVTPTVSADRRYVTLELQPYISTVEFEVWPDPTGPLQLPRFSSTSIGTTVTVPDRGWLLLGGLNQAGETEAEAGVPIISKIPILKRAYTNRSRVKDERTLLILVKPTIIIQGEIEEEAFPNLVSTNQPASGG